MINNNKDWLITHGYIKLASDLYPKPKEPKPRRPVTEEERIKRYQEFQLKKNLGGIEGLVKEILRRDPEMAEKIIEKYHKEAKQK